MCGRGIDFVSIIFLLDFGTVPTVCNFSFFISLYRLVNLPIQSLLSSVGASPPIHVHR